MPSIAPVLVLGSTGKTGRRIVQRLRARGLSVREGSRQASVPFDWNAPDTWPIVLAGVERVYISFYPDISVPTAEPAIAAFTAAAARAGAKQLVLLSGRGEYHAERCENLLRNSGLEFTLLRASWFAQNFSEGQLLGSVLSGMLALPAGYVREPFVDVDDIADVATAALTEQGHAGRLYDLTGPRLLNFAEVAREISQASGRPLAYQPLSLDDFRAGMEQEAGPDLAHMLTDLFAEVFDGRNAKLGDGIQQAVGRAPRDFTSFCQASAASGVWSAGVSATAS
jgi:uncharacterized protein YbjT (DUF2867 family)